MASWEEGIHFLAFKNSFKTLLPGRGHQEGSGSPCIAQLTGAKQLPASLPGLGSHRNSLRSQAALTYPSLVRKIAIIHVKQRPFIL